MLESVARSKNLSERHKLGYRSLKFFVNSSKNRLQKVRTGSRLAHVLDTQIKKNKDVRYVLTR